MTSLKVLKCNYCGNIQKTTGVYYYTCVNCRRTNKILEKPKEEDLTELKPKEEPLKINEKESLEIEVKPKPKEEEVKKYKCARCGFMFNEKINRCPNCKIEFDI